MSDELKCFEAALAERGAELSEAGARRRSAIRAELLRAARPRRTAGVLWGLGVAAAVLVSAISWAWLRPAVEGGVPVPVVALGGAPDKGTAALAFTHIDLAVVGDDASVLDRYVVASSPAQSVTRVNDAELIALLAATGHQTGLIRIGDAVLLTTPLDMPDDQDHSSAVLGRAVGSRLTNNRAE